MPRPVVALIVEARRAMGVAQAELAAQVGVSLRTVQRWEARASSPVAIDLHRIADAVRPHDAELAAEIDVWAPRPQAPQVPQPPQPAPPPPAAPPVAGPVLVDSVVCAAAEAMALAPQVVRPAVLAALVRMRDAGLTADGVIAALGPAPRTAKPDDSP